MGGRGENSFHYKLLLGIDAKDVQKDLFRAFFASLSKRQVPFPLPSTIVNEGLDDLRRKIPIGYRAEYLKTLAQAFSRNFHFESLEEKTLCYNEAYGKVSKLKGFGPYASTHLLVLAGYYEKIPVDSEISRFIRRHYKCRNVESFISRHYGPWGQYRWWGLKLERMLRNTIGSGLIYAVDSMHILKKLLKVRRLKYIILSNMPLKEV